MMLPAVWPEDVRLPEPPKRWSAEPEPWEREFEPFEGATVLEDLEGTSDAAEATLVVARYAVVRLVIRAESGVKPLALAEERAAAVAYLEASVDAGEAERKVLRAVLRGAARRPRRELAAALIEAGHLATKTGHRAGAYALFRTAYVLGRGRRWWGEAGRAARAIAGLAQAGGGRRSERRWRRRAAVLARRVALEAAREAAAKEAGED